MAGPTAQNHLDGLHKRLNWFMVPVTEEFAQHYRQFAGDASQLKPKGEGEALPWHELCRYARDYCAPLGDQIDATYLEMAQASWNGEEWAADAQQKIREYLGDMGISPQVAKLAAAHLGLMADRVRDTLKNDGKSPYF